MTDHEKQRHELEMEQIRTAIDKSIAQTLKLQKETRWYEIVIFTALGGVLVAAGKFLL